MFCWAAGLGVPAPRMLLIGGRLFGGRKNTSLILSGRLSTCSLRISSLIEALRSGRMKGWLSVKIRPAPLFLVSLSRTRPRFSTSSIVGYAVDELIGTVTPQSQAPTTAFPWEL